MYLLEDLMGITALDLIPKIKEGAVPQVHKLLDIPNKPTIELANLVPLAVAKAMLRTEVRPYRKIGERKARGSRVSDEQILQMNVLYEQGNGIRLIADQFELSLTYTLNLIQRYRVDNNLVQLSKIDRNTTRNQNSGVLNKSLINRAKTLKKMKAKREARGTYNRREDGQPTTSSK